MIVSGHKANPLGLSRPPRAQFAVRYHLKQKSGANKSAFRPSCDILVVVDFDEGPAQPPGPAKGRQCAEGRRRTKLGLAKITRFRALTPNQAAMLRLTVDDLIRKPRPLS
jgi:hypothetical protein